MKGDARSTKLMGRSGRPRDVWSYGVCLLEALISPDARVFHLCASEANGARSCTCSALLHTQQARLIVIATLSRLSGLQPNRRRSRPPRLAWCRVHSGEPQGPGRRRCYGTARRKARAGLPRGQGGEAADVRGDPTSARTGTRAEFITLLLISGSRDF